MEDGEGGPKGEIEEYLLSDKGKTRETCGRREGGIREIRLK